MYKRQTLPLLMLAAIIFTANHYVIDAIIGGAIVLAALAAVRLVEIARERWRGRSSPSARRERRRVTVARG